LSDLVPLLVVVGTLLAVFVLGVCWGYVLAGKDPIRDRGRR
jgi:hypothetical protein